MVVNDGTVAVISGWFPGQSHLRGLSLCHHGGSRRERGLFKDRQKCSLIMYLCNFLHFLKLVQSRKNFKHKELIKQRIETEKQAASKTRCT